MVDGGDFSSFKDLLGQFGDDDGDDDASSAAELSQEEAAEAADIAADGDDGDDDVGSYEGGARELIDERGLGFGPMNHGPKRYADVESEEMELFQSFRVRTVFPADVLAEIASLADDPDEADFKEPASRRDLRGERIFTIDGQDAKDYDDAIAIRRVDGGVEVSVHIADVSHYVRPGTALNAEALARATSVYVADQVVPMLPEELSNGLCSLVPDRPRLAFSVFMQFDDQGKRKGYYLTKSVIRSARRMTYKAVQELLDGVDNEDTQRLADYKEDLELFQAWTKTQQKLRDRSGSLRMQSAERKFRFDEKGDVVGIYRAENYFSQTLIEETALAANQAVGDFFKFQGLPTIYRVHPEKDQEEIDATVKMLEEFGIRVPKKDRLTGRDIGAMVRYARTLANSEAMIARVMGLMERASYEVQAQDDEAEHFGLAREHYLHFTSPIRRYPDLIVHRMLNEALERGEEAKQHFQDSAWIAELIDVAAHSSMQAEVASMVEIAVDDLKICQFMDDRIGEEILATVGRVSRAGIDIEIREEFVKGFLPARSIGNQVKLEGARLTIGSRKRTRVFQEGEAIKVIVKDVDFVRLKVIFELAEGR